MREFDAFSSYPSAKREANRTIKNRIIASYRDKEFYDGDRQNGYGGFSDDVRWEPIAKGLVSHYGLTEDSMVLQIGSHKGFLLHHLKQMMVNVRGLEVSQYAIEHTKWQVKPFVRHGSFTSFPWPDREFDLVLCVSPVYSNSLPDAIQCLKEIQRVGKGRSFITLGAWETQEEYWILRRWMLLGTTLLRKDEWLEVLDHCGYTGDYRFDTVQSLNLT